MLEDYCYTPDYVLLSPKKTIAYYFGKVKDLELDPGYSHFLSTEAKQSYAEILQEAYDILFDRVMTNDFSPFLKQEVEQWYGFNRDFLGFCDTKELNRELEKMLTRFELL